MGLLGCCISLLIIGKYMANEGCNLLVARLCFLEELNTQKRTDHSKLVYDSGEGNREGSIIWPKYTFQVISPLYVELAQKRRRSS